MIQNYFGEKWKTVLFDFEYTNNNRVEISNFGRVRSFNKTSNGKMLKISMVNGYQIIRFKFFKQRDEATDIKLGKLKKKVATLTKEIKEMALKGQNETEMNAAEKVLVSLKKSTSKHFLIATKQRTINYHSLIHRLVAVNFLRTPSANQTIVAHIDYDKLNNRFNNLKWMTPEENSLHQQQSPLVIKVRKENQEGGKERSKSTKLTVIKVMLLKKMLNEGKPIKQLVKQFRITDTQVYRIKRGENWAGVQAAK